MAERVYNLIDGGRKYGPFSKEELAAMLESGEIVFATLCIRAGDGEIREVAELFDKRKEPKEEEVEDEDEDEDYEDDFEEVAWEEEMDGRAFHFGIQRASLLKVDGRFLCLGEMGTLLWMDLSPEGVEVQSRVQLFIAPETWSLACLWHGLLYVCQHGDDYQDGATPRVICYDLREE